VFSSKQLFLISQPASQRLNQKAILEQVKEKVLILQTV